MTSHRRMAGRAARALGALVLAAASARAQLPEGSWPQARCDAARTGRVDEPGLAQPAERWSAPVSATALTGEPVAIGCLVAVTAPDGTVHAFDARTGGVAWTRPAGFLLPATGASSSLAFDGAGRLHVGLPADPFVHWARETLRDLVTALNLYSIDEGGAPTGPDLGAALVPDHLAAMPVNPLTGLPMAPSDTPSPGDYRYAPPSGGRAHLGIWTDDGLIGHAGCDHAEIGFDPAWPASTLTGGTALALDAFDGRVLARDRGGPATHELFPAVVPAGIAWTSSEHPAARWGQPAMAPGSEVSHRRGALTLEDLSGTSLGTSRGFGSAPGGAARDAATGRVVIVRRDVRHHDYLGHGIPRALSDWSVDHGSYPEPSGGDDLLSVLVPTYLRCVPANAWTDAPIRQSQTPSAGDFAYESTGTDFRLRFWHDDGRVLLQHRDLSIDVWLFSPTVEAFEPDGTRAWRAEVGYSLSPAAPPAIMGDLVVALTEDVRAHRLGNGSRAWLTRIRPRADLAPVVLPGDAGVVIVTGASVLVALAAADGDELWRRDLGARVTASPSASRDLVHAGTEDGVLHAIRAGDGSVAWTVPLGGPGNAALTTTPIQSHGWIHVGRADGVLVGAAPAGSSARPAGPGPVLRATGEKGADRAGFHWPGAPAVPGWHLHLRKWQGDLALPGEDVLPGHPSTAPGHLDLDAAGPLLFYRLETADCEENVSASGP